MQVIFFYILRKRFQNCLKQATAIQRSLKCNKYTLLYTCILIFNIYMTLINWGSMIMYFKCVILFTYHINVIIVTLPSYTILHCDVL